MFIYVNKNNLIVDMISEPRWVKWQTEPALLISCAKEEATGVIGSDCDTFYSLDSVSVYEINEPIGDFIPNVYAYDNGECILRKSIGDIQAEKQKENREKFAEFLDSQALVFSDGKSYGVTANDQSEISLNLSQYKAMVDAGAETPILEWHAIHEENTTWSYEELSRLSAAISSFVYPYYHKMQQLKTKIYSTQSIAEILEIELSYED